MATNHVTSYIAANQNVALSLFKCPIRGARYLTEHYHRFLDGRTWATSRAFSKLAGCKPASFFVANGAICTDSFDTDYLSCVQSLVAGLRPWRKGPFMVNGWMLDAEWDCSVKWDRLAKQGCFAGKQLLDVGTGNGYYLYRFLQAGAARVVGLEPHPVYYYQFLLFNYVYHAPGLALLPFSWQSCVDMKPTIDTVVCLGVLYHTKYPLRLLHALRTPLKKGGELFLETLIVPSQEVYLHPIPGRYACMKNIAPLPSLALLKHWLYKAGFTDVEVCDVSATTEKEQRATAFSTTQSVKDFLDQHNCNKTIEGHPAPIRALVKAVYKPSLMS